MKVEVYADVACPWCRIGKRRFDEARAQAGVEDVELVHLPYQLDPEESGEATPLTERMRRLYGEGSQAMFDEMKDLGRREGVEFRFDHAVSVNTFAAHRLLAYMLTRHGADTQAAVANDLFAMYFLHGGNIAEHGQLVELASRHGADAAAFREHLESDDGVDDLRARIADARAEGITSVPTFVFSDGRTVRGAADVETYASALRTAVG